MKGGGVANSKIPSIFDHVVRNSSNIQSTYQSDKQWYLHPSSFYLMPKYLVCVGTSQETQPFSPFIYPSTHAAPHSTLLLDWLVMKDHDP